MKFNFRKTISTISNAVLITAVLSNAAYAIEGSFDAPTSTEVKIQILIGNLCKFVMLCSLSIFPSSSRLLANLTHNMLLLVTIETKYITSLNGFSFY